MLLFQLQVTINYRFLVNTQDESWHAQAAEAVLTVQILTARILTAVICQNFETGSQTRL